ncbi:glutathione S-transferase family protein [Parahaliea mediterranea]|uniref:glutathione S-transferase family protein n=1 Tax=Parahaliea mediterranea TaxID=651086 RepID=UPI000E2E4DF2|nr:glutathione S-transferase family protein [Parahaliea mediterranea]
MTDFILHHYAISPFAAKIRAMLGYAELPWRSATTTPMPPRPLVDALAGGYRRIPVAQLGADIFCDSRIICEEIAALSGRASLSPATLDSEQQAFVDKAELGVFFTLVGKATGWPLVRKVVADVGPLGLLRLLGDRKAMRAKMNAAVLPPADGAATLQAHLDELEARLAAPYLHGEQPGIMDFSAWHGLWFATEVGGKTLLGGHPAVADWAGRINHLHRNDALAITASDCLAAARDNTPRPLAEHTEQHTHLGRTVCIAPSDYAQEAVTGELVASLPGRFILRRQSPEAGTLHVHFPRERFSLALAD